LLQNVSNPKSQKISAQTAMVSIIISLDIKMEYYKIIIPDYKVSGTINLWWRHIHVHHTTNEKYIQKSKRIYFIETKSPGQLIFGRNMLNIHHTKSGSISAQVNNVLLRK
jgi:hypothetical protein